MMFTCFIICFIIGVSSGEENAKIIDGNEIDIESHPYVVSLRYNDNHICGGVILDKRTILSSYQCLFDLTVRHLISTRVGSSEHAKGEEYKVAMIVPPKDYKRDFHENDIAIAKLANDLIFSDKVKPIGLPNKQYVVPDNQLAVFVGWGVQKAGDSDVSPTLRVINVKTMSYMDCINQYGINMIYLGMMVCAHTNDREFCRGDLGGPLVIDNIVVGIASWIYDCDKTTYPGVYTNVAMYSDWITMNLEPL